MRRHLWITLIAVAIFAAWTLWQRGCPGTDPDIVVAGGAIMVRNHSINTWTGVRVWVNDYYSGSTEEIRPGGFVRESVTRFVAAQGQTLKPTVPITSVVVLATTASGAPVRLVWGKPFWH